MLALPSLSLLASLPIEGLPLLPSAMPLEAAGAAARRPVAAVDPDEDEELPEDDLPLAEPTDEESNFDDFDDEFDDDFEEEENDPDWDHPDEAEPEPPAKGPGGKK